MQSTASSGLILLDLLPYLQVLVVDASWPQRLQFLRKLRQKLDSIPQRVAWYPGSDTRIASFMKRFPDAEQLGQYHNNGSVETSPWLMATGLTPDTAQTLQENWCGVLQVSAACRIFEVIEKACERR